MSFLNTSRVIVCRMLLTSLVSLVLNGTLGTFAQAEEPASDQRPRTLFVTRSLTHPELMPYIRQAKPEIVQIGNYGAMFHGYANHEKSVGWPMQLPVAGEKAALAYQKDLNRQVHEQGLKVVGVFRLIKVMGSWEEKTHFVDYYNNHWPVDLLGPKPTENLPELLQQDAEGNPIQLGRYNQAQLALCMSNPDTREILKRMLKVAVNQDIDGVMTTFNYYFGCACPHCQSSFKSWLSENHTQAELAKKLGIKNLEKHKFQEIPARISGYPDPAEAGELEWLAAAWAAEHFKAMFDEIFIDYGRSLKKDLILAQWNHLSHVSIAEERAFLPLEMYGRDEDYYWYSGGAAFVGKNQNLKEGKAGDAWLTCLYVREMGGGKPFVIGKYDRIRMEASMAEGYATDGLGMGRYMRFEDPHAFEKLVSYTNFMHSHRQLYDGAKPYSEAALVLPRQSVLNRRPDALDMFRSLGQQLLERQLLLDVLADQKISAERLKQYPAVILPQTVALSNDQIEALHGYVKAGGELITVGEIATLDEHGNPREDSRMAKAFPKQGRINETEAPAAADAIKKLLLKQGHGEIKSPWTVRAIAYEQPERVLLHLVNYDRDETKPAKELNGPISERPIAAKEISVRLKIPAGKQATEVLLHAPEEKKPTKLKFAQKKEYVEFVVPSIRVYGVCDIGIKD